MMRAPYFTWMCFTSLVIGCLLIISGVFLASYRHRMDEIKAMDYKTIFYPVSEESFLIVGIVLIVAGLLLLFRFVAFLLAFKQYKGMLFGLSRQIRKEIHAMVCHGNIKCPGKTRVESDSTEEDPTLHEDSSSTEEKLTNDEVDSPQIGLQATSTPTMHPFPTLAPVVQFEDSQIQTLERVRVDEHIKIIE